MQNIHLRLPSPAKINYFLRVLDQRSDGYHNLQTLFQFIDLVDYLTFESLDCLSQEKMPFDKKWIHATYHNKQITEENDLILRAAESIEPFAKKKCWLRIDLEKNIPLGGGLGGGSSNAATTLLALNSIWQANLSISELLKIAASIGSDVPIFVRGMSAWAEGRGEHFQEVLPQEKTIGIIYPNFSIQTAKIFSSSQLARNNPHLDIQYFERYEGLNDCQSAIFYHYPEMKEIIDQLSVQGIDAHITGTGACIFFDYPLHKQNFLKQICEQKKWLFWHVNTCNHSPLKSLAPALFSISAL